MNDTMIYDQDEQDEQSELSIGGWLSELRQAKKMSVADVAAHLRLREERVTQIEEGQYHNEISTYIKGYIRNYAALLGIDSDVLETKLATLVISERCYTSPMKLRLRSKYRMPQLWHGSRMSLILLVLGMCLLWVVVRAWTNGHPVDATSQRLEALVKVEPASVMLQGQDVEQNKVHPDSGQSLKQV